MERLAYSEIRMKWTHIFLWIVLCVFHVVNSAPARNEDHQRYHDYPPINVKDSYTGPEPGNEPPEVAPSYHGFPYNYRGFPYNYVGFPYGMSYGYPAGMSDHQDEIDRFSCPADGIFYRDEYSFYSCYDNDFRVLYCAPGSMNKPPSFYDVSSEHETADFCAINLTWHVPGSEII